MATANRAIADTVSADAVRRLVPKSAVLELKRRDDIHGLMFLAGHLGTAVCTGALVHVALDSLWVVPAIVLHGAVLACFFAPYHEAGHYTVFKTQWLNTFTMWLAGLIILNPPTRFIYAHVNHHAYTQDVTRDPQNLKFAENPSGWIWYGSGIGNMWIYLKQMFRFLSPRFLSEVDHVYLPKEKVDRAVRDCRIFWLIYLAIAVVSIYYGTAAALVYWLVPRLAGEWLQSSIRLSEHVGCGYDGDMVQRTRTVYTCAPLRLLCWNMPYHVEHHAFPNIPFHALPAVNRYLKEAIVHQSDGYLRHVAKLAASWFRRAALAEGR